MANGSANMGTNYDEVAPHYDQRYERNRYPGTTEAVMRFAGQAPPYFAGIGRREPVRDVR